MFICYILLASFRNLQGKQRWLVRFTRVPFVKHALRICKWLFFGLKDDDVAYIISLLLEMTI